MADVFLRAVSSSPDRQGVTGPDPRPTDPDRDLSLLTARPGFILFSAWLVPQRFGPQADHAARLSPLRRPTTYFKLFQGP